MKWKVRAFFVVTAAKILLLTQLTGLHYKVAFVLSAASTGLMIGYLETEHEYRRNSGGYKRRGR